MGLIELGLMNRVVIAVFLTGLVSLGGTTGWYFNQQSELESAQKLLARAKQAQKGTFRFNEKSNIESIKSLLVYLAEMDIPDIWITNISYDGGKVGIKYRARNAEAVTEYLQAFYDEISGIPFVVDEVSANEKGKKSTKVAKKRVRKVPFVLAYIQKKLQSTRKALGVGSKAEESIEQDYNYELSVKLGEE